MLWKTFFKCKRSQKEFGDDFTNLNTAYFEYLNNILIITQNLINQAHLSI